MKKSKTLTRSTLEGVGIVCVSGDGNHIIRKDGFEYSHITISALVGKFSGKELKYDAVATSKLGVLPTHRVVYAWFYGIVPENMDIDHIDHNTMNNSVSNLRCITHKENLDNRLRKGNQYNCHWTDDEYNAYSLWKENRAKWTLEKKELQHTISLKEQLARQYKEDYAVARVESRRLGKEWHNTKVLRAKVEYYNALLVESVLRSKWHTTLEEIDRLKFKRATEYKYFPDFKMDL